MAEEHLVIITKFLFMPIDIREYICLEYNENEYNIMDILSICEELNIPFSLGFFHNSIFRESILITDQLL